MDAFLAARPALFALAYRMLGSASEAEDVLQEAWLRWDRASGLDNDAAWLTTVVTRLCLDVLGSARARRETYVGPWLPEPLVDGPEVAVELADSVSLAFLVLLEELSPAERAAFLLREVFRYDYDEVGSMLERSPAACRQLVSRAHGHVDARRTRFTADKQQARELSLSFLFACQTGDLAACTSMLAADAVLVSDGGGKVSAARRPVFGADRVARFLIGVVAKPGPPISYVEATVNGEAGVVGLVDGVVIMAVAVEVVEGQITGIRMVSNPDKLVGISAPA
ncbi:MAG: polymerase, sigma subunit, family [Frankiales bacterium]|jgi:RNA polymerase sigma-70 factor (TIGR02957 family)|nr:polymerase, sigma subunit, family [Frankiales bacterium]